jgi:hypothetical protein
MTITTPVPSFGKAPRSRRIGVKKQHVSAARSS